MKRIWDFCGEIGTLDTNKCPSRITDPVTRKIKFYSLRLKIFGTNCFVAVEGKHFSDTNL